MSYWVRKAYQYRHVPVFVQYLYWGNTPFFLQITSPHITPATSSYSTCTVLVLLIQFVRFSRNSLLLRKRAWPKKDEIASEIGNGTSNMNASAIIICITVPLYFDRSWFRCMAAESTRVVNKKSGWKRGKKMSECQKSIPTETNHYGTLCRLPVQSTGTRTKWLYSSTP